MEIHSFLQINSVIPVLSFQTRELIIIIIYVNMFEEGSVNSSGSSQKIKETN